jgi:diaminopimelate decarboxylase
MNEAPRALSASLAARLAEELFATIDGELQIGNLPASRLAEAYGTPLYVYDVGVAGRVIRLLRDALPGNVEIYYSAKANPNPEFIRCLVAEGAGVEVSSCGEYLRARRGGARPDRIVFTGPGKTAAELEVVVRDGVEQINVESAEEIELLEGIGSRLSMQIPCAIRVNPSAPLGGGAMRMGGRPSPFGIDEDCLGDAIAAVLRASNLRLAGVHVHAATQILDAEAVLEYWRCALNIARRAAGAASLAFATVDLGGGLGIPYFEHDSPLDLRALARGAAELVSGAAGDPLLRRARFILEPGRFLAGPCGVYLTRVLSVKRSYGKQFIVMDGGANHNLAASGNLGQIIKRDYPILNASRAGATATTEYTVVGPLCTPVDTLGRGVGLPPTRAGDLIAVLQSGAYGLTASPCEFLSHPTPAEVLVEHGSPRLIRERGTFHQPIAPLR